MARRYSDARKRGAEHGTFTSNTVRLPDGMSWFRVEKAGTRRIDVIPYEVKQATSFAEAGDLHYEKTFWVHRGVGPNNESFCCPRKNWGKKCPVCEYRTKLAADPNADEEVVKSLSPKERQLWFVVDVDDRERGVQVWDVSYHLFGKKVDEYIRDADEDDGYEKFFHLDDGLTIKVGFSEKKYGSQKFFETATIDFKPRREGYDETMLEDLPSLDDLLIETAYEKIRKVFLQTDAEDEDTDDEPGPVKETPKRVVKVEVEEDIDDEPPAKPARRGRAKPEPEEDEEEVVPKKPKKQPVPDDDDEPWDDWDDEKE